VFEVDMSVMTRTRPLVTRNARRFIVIGLASLSALVTVPVLLALIAFDSAPVAGTSIPEKWPQGAGIERPVREAQLLVFAHPFCACTGATIAELARLETLRRNRLPSPTFLVFRPSKTSDWTWAAFQTVTRSLPDARVIWDDGGLAAARFHAIASGTVLLYSENGDLLFHGGVTGSRGHEGDNYGLDELTKALEATPGSPSQPKHSRVFGCALGFSQQEGDAGSLRFSPLRAWFTRATRDLRSTL
jgi:hypothetical protein